MVPWQLPHVDGGAGGPGANMQQCLAVTLQYKFNFLQLGRWYLQLKFVLAYVW